MVDNTERERCLEAMDKPAPVEALRLIASGRVIIEFGSKPSDVYIDSFDGQTVRDPEDPDRKMILSGAWPLHAAGMIDDFGLITDAGKKLLEECD